MFYDLGIYVLCEKTGFSNAFREGKLFDRGLKKKIVPI